MSGQRWLPRAYDFLTMSFTAIEQLGHHVQHYAATVLTVMLLSPTWSLESMVSKRVLELHTCADKVFLLWSEMNFLLADPSTSSPTQRAELESRSGEYMRYRYNFFMERGVDEGSYTSLLTFPDITLIMRRAQRYLAPSDLRFFPLR